VLNTFLYQFCAAEPTRIGIWHYVTAETMKASHQHHETSGIQSKVQEMLDIFYIVGHSTLGFRGKPLAIAPCKLFAHLEGETRLCQVRRFTAYQLTSRTTYSPDC
jgi:hypothetical protein